MNEQIKQIAERLRGLRDVLDLTPEEVAESCQLTVEAYLEMESGNKDISVSALQQIARKYEVSLDVLMFGVRYNYSNPKQLRAFLDKFPNITVIGAHFAGWSMWEEATEKLAGTPNLYVDLSSSLYALSSETAKELIHAYGVDKVLWGSDYPMWESVSEMEYFNKIDLTDEERKMILYENAARLLNID